MPKPLASTDRALGLRLRPDLLVVPAGTAGDRTWVVKDPLTLEHFYFSVEEYALLEMLRGQASLADIVRQFAAQFSPKTITLQELWAFLSRLHEAGLVISDSEGQGE
jgi:hypothetical protein